MTADTRRRLLWHGVLLVLLGLLTGMLLPLLRNPRLGLSAHVGGVMNGMLLVLLGLIWLELRLSERVAVLTFRLALFSMYVIWAATLLGAAFGTSRANPIAGAGYAGAPWQEAIVMIGLTTGALAVLVAFGGVLYGLRRT